MLWKIQRNSLSAVQWIDLISRILSVQEQQEPLIGGQTQDSYAPKEVTIWSYREMDFLVLSE